MKSQAHVCVWLGPLQEKETQELFWTVTSHPGLCETKGLLGHRTLGAKAETVPANRDELVTPALELRLC